MIDAIVNFEAAANNALARECDALRARLSEALRQKQQAERSSAKLAALVRMRDEAHKQAYVLAETVQRLQKENAQLRAELPTEPNRAIGILIAKDDVGIFANVDGVEFRAQTLQSLLDLVCCHVHDVA